ncbi:putative disease resistance protein At4g19050 [Humulus lupulus]|uniref:putative disease resistance protein At4g19050 n=1 Tax=Humulus lupulus TaxID=3486 RepID=UPI002B405AC5|nr:putative disease resistance protein At4g19050 [Humulus lupulus]XP_062087375.1 putative disease resistance protein At4g19050 [Humulus lupulus]
MGLATVDKVKEEILQLLKDGDVTTIILEGKQGVGKTRMAREILNQTESIYDFLWVSLNRKYSKQILHKKIAQALSPSPNDEDWEEDAEEGKQEKQKTLKQRLTIRLKEKAPEGKKSFLLILDDVPPKQDEEDIMTELNTLQSKSEQMFKVLITRRENDDELTGTDLKKKSYKVCQLKPLEGKDSLILFKENINHAPGMVISDSDLTQAVMHISSGIPAAIITIAEALNSIRQDHSEICILSVLKEAACDQESAYRLTHRVLNYWCNMLPDSIMVNCFRHSMQFFCRHGGVHYNELISHWILEGCLGNVDQIQKAYEQGHNVLMELIGRKMLTKQEIDVVVMEGSVLCSSGCCQSCCNQNTSLGLANVFEDEKWQGFGRITRTVGTIKSLSSWEEVSTILMDGSHLYSEDTKTLFQSMQGLEVFSVFNPWFRNLSWFDSSTSKLLMLVLRGCHSLENIDDIDKLRSLCVLEISSGSLTSIHDDVFSNMDNLRSINLSFTNIKSLPKSLFKRGELRYLILRRCSQLEKLQSLEALKNLEVIDLSGATSLTEIEGNNFSSLKKLNMLNLSESKINCLPSLPNVGDLTQLLLSGCSYLTTLSNLETLSRLQVLDLSGARRLEKLEKSSLENMKELKILNLSGTAIRQLPSTRRMENLEVLDLSGAIDLVEIEDQSLNHLRFLRILNISKSKLKELPQVNALEELEVLNLSGCSSLKVIKDESFEKLSRLQILDLSETQVKFLPTLCKPCNLSRLSLRSCTNLTMLTSHFLEGMTRLEILDLSGTQLEELPSMSQFSQLRQLKLRECSPLKDVQSLDSLKQLEILDISGTAVGCLPSLETCSKLQQLLLKDCSQIEGLLGLGSLSHLEVLNLSGTNIKGFPYEIAELCCLKHVDLPDLKDVDEIDWGRIKHLPEEVNWDGCGIMKPDKISRESNIISMSLSGTSFFNFLEKNPMLLEMVTKKFHLSVGTPKKQSKDGNINSFEGETFFKDVYFHMRHIPKDADQFLEICGSYSLPDGFEIILKHTQYLSLIDNNLIKCLSELGDANVRSMIGCWIEKCSQMESIFSGKEEGSRMWKNLEILWISNVPSLNRLYSGSQQTMGFENLKHLYINCCPEIEHVFYTSQLPENLETIHVKFCDKLKTLFEWKTEAGSCELQKPLKVWLFELPEFTSLGMQFHPLQQLIVRHENCPKFKLESSTSANGDLS